MKVSKLIFAGLALTFAGAFALESSAEELVIVCTNDTHSQIDPDDMDGLGGILRRKVVIDSIREARENVLLIDAGDIVQGTLYFNLFKGEVEEEFMNRLGYDIRILGNHEFDNGMDSLANHLRGAKAELICSNYDFDGTPVEGIFKPYTIKTVGDKKIGFFAVNLRPEGMISSVNSKGVKYLDVIKSSNALAWYLKNIEKVDKVVAISHIGYNIKDQVNDIDLISNSEDIDLVLGAHSHTLIKPGSDKTPLPNANGEEIVVTQSGKAGKYIAEVTIDLDDPAKLPEYNQIRIDSRLDDRIDASLDSLLIPYRAVIDKSMKKKVAKSSVMLDKDEAPLLNFVADYVFNRGNELIDNVDLSIVNKGGIRRSLPKGDITEGMIITMLPFSNRVQVLDIKGSDLIAAFNVMVATDGNGISRGMDITYDPEKGECTSILLNGEPIDPDHTYRLATIDYLADGGDYMKSLRNGSTVAVSDKMLYDDLLNYLTIGKGKGKKINPDTTVRMHR